MFDTHCHLNFKAFKNSYDQVIKDAYKVGVKNIVIPGTDIETSQKAVEIAEKYNGIYATVGIHPHHANVGADFMSAHLQEIEKLITYPKVVAIGEVGLDKHEYQNTKYEKYVVDNQFINAQKALLTEQIKLAITYKKSLILHNREAKKEILEALIKPAVAKALAGKAVFHCCEPDFELLNFAIKYHIYIGVDGDVTFNQEKQEFIKKVPLDLLVLETDSPYLLPRPPRKPACWRGGRSELLRSKKAYPNKPENIKIIAKFIAQLCGQPVDLIKEKTTENAKKLFFCNLIYGFGATKTGEKQLQQKQGPLNMNAFVNQLQLPK